MDRKRLEIAFTKLLTQLIRNTTNPCYIDDDIIGTYVYMLLREVENERTEDN